MGIGQRRSCKIAKVWYNERIGERVRKETEKKLSIEKVISLEKELVERHCFI